MITTFIFDFSRVLLFPKDQEYTEKLNSLHNELSKNPEYKFLEHFEFNEPLFAFLQKIKDKYTLCIFTSGTVQNAPEAKSKIEPIFQKIYSAQDMRWSKEDPRAYLLISNDLHKNPSELLFIDDSIENIRAAQKAKLSTLHFESTKQFFTEMSKLFPEL